MSRPLRPDIAETYRRFVVGDTFHVSGLDFEVFRGAKRPDGSDLVIRWRTPNGWVPIGMDAVFLLADFLYENEHAIFPLSMRYEGGEKFRRALVTAMSKGWKHASWTLDAEKSNAEAKGQQMDLLQDGAA